MGATSNLCTRYRYLRRSHLRDQARTNTRSDRSAISRGASVRDASHGDAFQTFRGVEQSLPRFKPVFAIDEIVVDFQNLNYRKYTIEFIKKDIYTDACMHDTLTLNIKYN